MKKIVCDNKEEFIKKYKELIQKGVRKSKIRTYTPVPVDGFHNRDRGKVKYFALFGSISGLIFGIVLTIYATLEWNEILGGKPPISIIPFIIIYYELLILFGGVISFLGFVILTKFPDVIKFIKGEKRIEEMENYFVIKVEEE